MVLKFKQARDSLKFVIKKYGIKKLFIPYYLCDVIRHSLFEINCKPIFYHIDDNFMPDICFSKKDYILYPNYFGICEKNVDYLVEKYPNIIIDNAHSFFSKPQGLACFNSAKKFGIADESYLWIKPNKNSTIPITNQTTQIKQTLLKKFQEYNDLYKNSNLLKIDNSSFSFCYPYLFKNTEEANKFVKELKREGKTVYRYWNQLPKTFNEYKFYSRLVPIPLISNNIQQDNLLHQMDVPKT